ncbi:hypothetical protein MP638_000460 [Amoeboaphelidium occidentale]|nr:hypothetical protein MP638_000460 [Amoeboaphelidium occidentale]
MTDKFQVLLNNGKVCEITRDLFEEFPKDSLLYNLLKDDQAMATKNKNGQYVLTLDYPEYFEQALTYVETDHFSSYKVYSATKDNGLNLCDSMNAFASTLNYLGFPVPEILQNISFNEKEGSLMDVASRIYSSAGEQLFDFCIEVRRNIVADSDILLPTCIEISKARQKTGSGTPICVISNAGLAVRDKGTEAFFIGLNKTTTRIDSVHKGLHADFKLGYSGTKWNPLKLLLLTNRNLFEELVKRHFVPVIVTSLCELTSTSLEKFTVNLVCQHACVFEITIALNLRAE